jgi:hypothetical protein
VPKILNNSAFELRKLFPTSCCNSVEELARYIGSQLRSLAGGLWRRLPFDVAVSSGPGQAGIVRFSGLSCSLRYDASCQLMCAVAGEAQNLVVGFTNAPASFSQTKPHLRKYSVLSIGSRCRIPQSRGFSILSGQSIKVSNAVSALSAAVCLMSI